MEEHKALKYCDYRDKLYMIIETENVDDTHPYNNPNNYNYTQYN